METTVIKFFDKHGTTEKPINNIIYVQGQGNYIQLFLTDRPNPVLLAKTVSWFENYLPATQFTRIHQSHLVNRDYIKEICWKGAPRVLLATGQILSVSRRKLKEAKKQLSVHFSA
jgi:two-component system, LytTR family, response regulator